MKNRRKKMESRKSQQCTTCISSGLQLSKTPHFERRTSIRTKKPYFRNYYATEGEIEFLQNIKNQYETKYDLEENLRTLLQNIFIKVQPTEVDKLKEKLFKKHNRYQVQYQRNRDYRSKKVENQNCTKIKKYRERKLCNKEHNIVKGETKQYNSQKQIVIEQLKEENEKYKRQLQKMSIKCEIMQRKEKQNTEGMKELKKVKEVFKSLKNNYKSQNVQLQNLKIENITLKDRLRKKGKTNSAFLNSNHDNLIFTNDDVTKNKK